MAKRSGHEAARRQPSVTVSVKRAAALKRTADKGLRPRDLETVIAHLERLRAKVRSDVGENLDRKIKGKLSSAEAKEIMGEGNYFGPEAVKEAFGIELAADQIPQIPFSKAELEQAKSLGQMLVLRVDKAPDGKPLTMKKMNEMLAPQLQTDQRGRLLYDTSWYQGEEFFTKDTPRAGWALVSKKVLANSTSKNDPHQTEVLAQEVRKVFQGMTIPENVQQALRQFEDQQKEIEGLLQTNWQEAARRLSQLDINKLFRRSPAEIIYDLVMVLKNSNERLLGDRYDRTSRLSSYGRLVALGSFDSNGVDVLYWSPYSSHPNLGVSFSRSQ